ncbi:MAG: DUF1838 domain-containing protein [Gammaproteobacteria bacterium]|nr:DUF1838 domain-containing protein [Gammaproteobacteria bacterium]
MTAKFETKIDFKSPIWNRDTWARIQGDLNPENERFSYAAGDVMGVVEGEKLKPLCGFETFLATRLVPQEDGTIRRWNKEVIFYTDLNPDPGSRRMIDTWHNPYTDEEVEVVHVANDPFNYTISEWLILAPEDFPTDGSPPKPRKFPLLFPWRKSGNKLALQTDMHLQYPNALQPDKWPRESSGKMARVSEIFRYWVDIDDVENPELTAVPYAGTWARITPWLPWMLMGQAPGHCQYMGIMIGGSTLEEICPQHVIDFAKERYPHMLSAPTEEYGPSISSLEYYAREQTPKPPKG